MGVFTLRSSTLRGGDTLRGPASGSVSGQTATETDTAAAGSVVLDGVVVGQQAATSDIGVAGSPNVVVVGQQAGEADSASVGSTYSAVGGQKALETDVASPGTVNEPERWVLVGGSNTIASSDDNGVTWTLRTSPHLSTTVYRAVARGTGKYVAVADLGRIAASTDGITWTTSSSGLSETGANNLNDVVYANGLWVAALPSNRVLTSPDAVTWTVRTLPGTTAAVQTVGYGGGLWVAGGVSGFLWTSPDAITWTLQSVPFTDTSDDVAYASDAGRWSRVSLIGQTIHTSTDGITWTQVFSGSDRTAVAYGAGLWVSTGSGMLSSTDGLTWTAGQAIFVLRELARGESVWVSVGANAIYNSSNGLTWTQRTSPNGASYEAVASNRAPSGAVTVVGSRATESDTAFAGGVILPGQQASETDVGWAGDVVIGVSAPGQQAIEIDSGLGGIAILLPGTTNFRGGPQRVYRRNRR